MPGSFFRENGHERLGAVLYQRSHLGPVAYYILYVLSAGRIFYADEQTPDGSHGNYSDDFMVPGVCRTAKTDRLRLAMYNPSLDGRRGTNHAVCGGWRASD